MVREVKRILPFRLINLTIVFCSGINTLLDLASGPHEITMAETPHRRISFASRSCEGRKGDDVIMKTSISCATPVFLHDDQHEGPETESNVSVIRNACQDERVCLFLAFAC